MLKKIFLFSLLLIIFLPNFVSAQNPDQIFSAQVTKILTEKSLTREDGSQTTQQNLELTGLEGKWLNQKIIFNGIGELDVLSHHTYQIGDKVYVSYNTDYEGAPIYYIIDYQRQTKIYWLFGLFVLLVLIIGRFKGFKALLGLIFSFLIIVLFILPQILSGTDPLLIAVIGSLFITLFNIYLTEGFNKKSHLTILTIFISLICVGFLSILFTNLAKLSGFIQEETLFLISSGASAINFQGLLLAGIIIGTLGVLDDVVISQIVSAQELKSANPQLTSTEIYKKTMNIGVSHMSSMINTLFLAYAGAALPLLLLFTLKQPPFLTFHQIINTENIATEIFRTLIGSFGLVLSIPLASFFASRFLKNKK